MKFILTVSAFLYAAVMLASFGNPEIDRVIRIDKSRQLTLAENGKSSCVIVVPADASPTANFAAKELQTFLKEATNADFPIVKAADPKKVSIIVGCKKNIAKLPRDGFIIKADGNKIVIAGKDDPKVYPAVKYVWGDYYERATLFGVYDFLERFVGARFVFPGKYGTVIPRHKTLKVPAMDIVERPDNICRSISWTFGKWHEDLPQNEVMQQRRINTYRYRTQTDYIPNCHGLGRMAYIERFAKTHPEYFALRPNGTRSNVLSERMGGQLCFSSGIVEEIYQDAKAFLQGKKAAERNIRHAAYRNAAIWDTNAAKNQFFNIMPQDGMLPCQCQNCKERAKVKGWEGRQVWQLTVDAANRLRKEGVPGYLTQMAYGFAKDIPEIAIPDNVLVMVAVLGPWGEYHANGWKDQQKLIRDWVKKMNNQKTWLWTYVNKYSGRAIADVPCSTPHSVGRFYSELRNDIFGSFMETETDRAIYQFFNWYVFSKIMWDKNTDVDKLLADTYKDLYGAGAENMNKFFALWEKVWLKEINGKVIMDETGPVSIQPTDSELWNRIYNDKFIAEQEKNLAAALRKAAGDAQAVERIKFIGDQYLGTLKRARSKFVDQQKSIGNLKKQIKPVADNTITLDGNLQEAAWKTAEKLYLRGLKNARTEVTTCIRLLRDSKNLYISYECEEPLIKKTFAPKLAADDINIWQSNSVEIFLNPDGTRKNYFQIMVSQAENITDSCYTFDGSRMRNNLKWNSNARAKVALQEKSWTVEIAIPLKNLGRIDENNIAADFTRNRMLQGHFRGTKHYIWSPYARRFHDYVNFGVLTFNEVKDNNIIKNGNFQGGHKDRLFFLFDEKGNPVRHGGWFADTQDVKSKAVKLDYNEFLLDGKSLRIDNDGKSICLSQYLRDLDPAKTYRLTFSVKTEMKKPGRYSYATVVIYNGKKQSGFPKPPIKGTSEWTTYSSTFKMDPAYAEKKVGYIRLYSYCFHGTVWFDNVRIEEVKE